MIVSFDIGETNFAYVIGTKDELFEMHHINIKCKKTQTVLESCNKITDILDSINFSSCTKVIIEQQLCKNSRALRIAQHLWTYVQLKYPNLRPEFVSSSIKTDRGLTYKQRKLCAIENVRSILKQRGDEKHLNYMSSLVKQDDVADAYIQLMKYHDRL